MEAALSYLENHQENFRKDLLEYLRFPSISAQKSHQKDLLSCAQWMEAHCRSIGLETELCQTPGNPVLVAKTPRPDSSTRPHYLVYGHYDVQPADPLHLWNSPPFEPVIRNNALFARGASDNKGQHFAHLKAIEAYLKTGTPLPCDVTFVIEGEEEVGSQHLAAFLKSRRESLKCKAVIISDNGIPDLDHPALTYALRGIAAMEIKVHGPNRDLHSGIYGGSVDNPAMALSKLLSLVHDSQGRITIPGFYDAVVELSDYEKEQLARIPFDKEKYREFLGVPSLYGEAGYTPVEQRSARPTFEVNGLTSGYQGDGSKTIIPSCASAKITMRLVPDQDPQKILALTADYLRQWAPKSVRLELEIGHCGEPYLVSPEGETAQASLRALKKAFGKEPVLMREGGSIPIVTEFRNILGADTLLLGLALPDDNPHSPNEKFDLACLTLGAQMGVYLWQELAAIPS